MKARESVAEAGDLLKELDKLENGFKDGGDWFNFVAGKPGDPVENIIRPVGGVKSCFLHYKIQQFSPDTEGLPPVAVCTGPGRCPICQAVGELKTLGTKESGALARALSASERSYWNVIPRDADYDFGPKGIRCVVLAFGKMARQSLLKMVRDYGHPGHVKKGFDIVYEVEERGGDSWGNNYKIFPHSKKVETEEGISTVVAKTPLTEAELDFEMIDLTRFTKPPSDEQMALLERVFRAVDYIDSTPQTVRREAGEEDDTKGDRWCYGTDEYNPRKNSCKNCELKERCAKKVKASQG